MLFLAIVVATIVGPFLIGFWIGHPGFASLAWIALGITLLLHQLQLDNGSPEAQAMLGIVLGSLISAAAAYGGAVVRERRRLRQD